MAWHSARPEALMDPWGMPVEPLALGMGLSQSAPRTCQWLHRMALPQPGILGTHPARAGPIRCTLRGLDFGSEAEETQGQRDFGVLTNGEFLVVHEASYGRFSLFSLGC